MKKFLKSFQLTKNFFVSLIGLFFLFLLSHFIPFLQIIAEFALYAVIIVSLSDIVLLYFSKGSIEAQREVQDRFNLGDDNLITIVLKSSYGIPLRTIMVDELPVDFQKRDFSMRTMLPKNDVKSLQYSVRPTFRGEFVFHNINVLVMSPISFVRRRFVSKQTKAVKVYPSYLQMRKYEFMAISNNLTEVGLKKVRKINRSNEFDHIRDYVIGDDYRLINWKATARKNQIMVNQYQDEKAQQIFCIIDLGRNMEMPFEEMTYVDYAVNTSLVFSNIALRKKDKAGLITFSKDIDAYVNADRKKHQIQALLEALYKVDPDFKEPNFEMLYSHIRFTIRKRSLIVLFTNFEGKSSLKRQLKYLKGIAKRHVLLLVIFQNTELNEFLKETQTSNLGFYKKFIGESVQNEKYEIAKELKQNGIYSVLTEPNNLSVSVINKYLEFKSKGII